MRREYVPERGDIVWLDFDPQAGREQSKTRPALVLSPASYNGKVGLAVVCPITSQVKDYPFEVLIPTGLPVNGVILSDHVKSLDWQVRNAQFICQLAQVELKQVLSKLNTLLK